MTDIAFTPGDYVRIRDDATTEGRPFGEIFLNRTYRVVAVDEPLIEISAMYGSTELKLHALTYKLRRATPDETPS